MTRGVCLGGENKARGRGARGRGRKPVWVEPGEGRWEGEDAVGEVTESRSRGASGGHRQGCWPSH